MTIKIALLGAGKTGSKVVELANSNEEVMIFNTTNKPTVEKIAAMDAVISFLPGPAFLEYIEILLASKTPVITGSTGMEWPEGIHKKLIDQKTTWIKAHNFALGMNIVKPIIEMMANATSLFPQASYQMHEVHHVHKKDAPSGTAVTWKDWLNRDVNITSERTGDVVGDHEITLRTEFEEITIKHRSLDRKIFASGALWATRYLLENNTESGLYPLEYIANKRIKENQ